MAAVSKYAMLGALEQFAEHVVLTLVGLRFLAERQGVGAKTPHYHTARISFRRPSAKNFCKSVNSKPDCPWAVRRATNPNCRRPGCPPRKWCGRAKLFVRLAAVDC